MPKIYIYAQKVIVMPKLLQSCPTVIGMSKNYSYAQIVIVMHKNIILMPKSISYDQNIIPSYGYAQKL